MLRSQEPPDAFTVHKCVHRRASPPCARSSANDRRRTRALAMLRQGNETSRKKCNACIEMFTHCFVAKNHRRYNAEQRRAAHSSRRTFGEVHHGLRCPRLIGDTSEMFSTCSCKQRRCIFDVVISRMIWVIHRRCSRAALLYKHRQPQSMWFQVKYLHLLMLSTRHYTIAMTSSRHHHGIVKTSPLRPRRIADICLSHAEGSPTIADSKSTSLSVSRCSAD